jgi:octaheme c-type cytochrome (tetrathionate reductase family)
MKKFKNVWVVGLIVVLLVVIVPLTLFVKAEESNPDNPWNSLPERSSQVDHSELMKGPYETGSDVTNACLECHETAAQEVVKTVHWTWESEPLLLPGREQPVSIGKKNLINNFCIGIQSNWPGCTRCHAGYGWEDADFDFSAEENVDCLVCHDQSGTYIKSTAGQPAEGVDLAIAAQSVATPTRQNCGTCHFSGGGGNAVKHGDLDESLNYPSETIDVHMGRHDFLCVDCHQTTNHEVTGHMISVSNETSKNLACTDCHANEIHDDERINNHVATVACQTCHIPEGAVRDATKMNWDWSAAGQDIPEDPHEYLKIKGSFVYEDNFVPEYYWFNGSADRYLLGDPIDPSNVTVLNTPQGDIRDPEAKIWPFKVHRATQIYDSQYDYLLQPKTVGEGGYWTEFDWDQAARLGSEAVGLDYSGEFGFAETEMYWLLTHMVAPKENALRCSNCHGESGRLNWEQLGYYGDPINWGGRSHSVISQAAENSD